MKCLLTGSHLARTLLEGGYEACVIDDLSTGSIENIKHLKGHRPFRYVTESVLNRSMMAEAVDEADIIFHLAAAVGVRLIVERPVRTTEANIKGTEVLLDLAAKKTSISHFQCTTAHSGYGHFVRGAARRERCLEGVKKPKMFFSQSATHRVCSPVTRMVGAI
jgi:nucleoside-diphosphate-sugar epimerase